MAHRLPYLGIAAARPAGVGPDGWMGFWSEYSNAKEQQMVNSLRTQFGSFSLSLSLGALMLLMTPTSGRADDRAFAWVAIAPPGEATLLSVQDVNNSGHVLAKLDIDETGQRAAVYRDGAWKILVESTGNYTTTGTDINNNGTVVGYSGSGGNTVARIWYYNAGDEEYYSGTNLGDDTEIWAINDNDQLAGFDVANGYPVAWFAATGGWVELDPLQGGDATAARGLNIDATVVGQSTEPYGQPENMKKWAVAWPGTSTPVKIDPNQQDEDDTPYLINENEWIVGARGTGNPYTYILWRPDGQGGWDDVESLGITGADAKAVGLNAYNEVVAKKSLFYEDENSDLQDVSLVTLSGIPTTTTPMGHFYSSNMAFYAINDNGWIVGKSTYYDAEQTSQGLYAILLVPFDRNNDEVPDYREIIADPSLDENDGDWVLDSTTKMRVGLYAIPVGAGTDQLVQDVDDLTAVRLHGNHDLVHTILTNPQTDPDACDNFRTLLSYLGGHDDPDHQGKEIILMIRTPWPSNEDLDYIPDAQTQETILADLRCFVSKYCRDIDYIQFGNEIFGGPGEYYVSPGGSCAAGTLSGITTSDCYIQACQDVFEWMQKQADAVRETSALAGRPLQLITPAVFYSQVNNGYENGSIVPPLDSLDDRAAYAVQCVVSFGNLNGAAVDIHLHYRDPEQRADMYSGVSRLLEGNSGEQENIWDPPFAITALEWSPVPSQTWAQDNRDDLNLYLQSNPDLLEGKDPWEVFIDGWAEGVFDDRTMEDLIGEDLDAFDGILRHACYGEYGQPTSGSLDQWDITVVRANGVHSADLPWMLETNYEKLTNVAKALATAAASYLPTDPFDPHPNEPYDDDCGCD